MIGIFILTSPRTFKSWCNLSLSIPSTNFPSTGAATLQSPVSIEQKNISVNI